MTADPQSYPSNPGGQPGDDEVKRLVGQLASAECALRAVVAGQVDAIVNPEGYAYLLQEAQRALLEKLDQARQAHREAASQATLLTAILEHAPDMIVQLDLDGTMLFVNRAPASLPVEKLIGKPYTLLAPPEFHEAMGAALTSVQSTGLPVEFERQGPERDGRPTWYSSRVGPVRRGGRITGFVVISRDVTDKKTAERQLMVSDRMASVGTLAAGVAHEINNPLAAVIANLGYIQQAITRKNDGTPLPADVLEALSDVRNAADRVRLVVRDLKLFSRADEEQRGPVNVEQALEATLRMAWNEIRHRARVVRDYKPVPLIHANESRLGQVFLNLIVNAAQAIPEGHFDSNVIRVGIALDSSGRVVVSIADTGCGMSEQVRRKLFTPFFTTKPIGVGTGLGLAICERIVTSLGGALECDSEPGKGTEFRVVLPAAEKTPGPAQTARILDEGARRRGRVLVIDDEVLVTTAARRTLHADHEVRVVNSALEAHALLQQGERFDVILCDLMMPQVTGMELYRLLQQLDAGQARRVVFMTGGAFTPAARLFLDTVPNARLEKPFDAQGLRTLVNRLIA